MQGGLNRKRIDVLINIMTGWGGRDRTCVSRDQNPMPYHLATPQLARLSLVDAGLCRLQQTH